MLQPHACARGPAPRSAPHPAPPPDRPRLSLRLSPCPAPTPTHFVPCSAPGADPARPSVGEPSERPGGLRGRRRCRSRRSLGDSASSAIQSAVQAPRTAGAGGPASRRPRTCSRRLVSFCLVRGFYLERVRLLQPQMEACTAHPVQTRSGLRQSRGSAERKPWSGEVDVIGDVGEEAWRRLDSSPQPPILFSPFCFCPPFSPRGLSQYV